jgi:hypothetical protein
MPAFLAGLPWVGDCWIVTEARTIEQAKTAKVLKLFCLRLALGSGTFPVIAVSLDSFTGDLTMAARTFLAFATLMFFSVTFALAQDASGSWHSEFDSQIGKQKYTFVFNVKGDKVTGKAIGEIKGEKRETDIQDGKVKGDMISFVEPLKIMDMEIKIEYSGKIKGDEITLKRKVGDFAEYDITLKRAKGK